MPPALQANHPAFPGDVADGTHRPPTITTTPLHRVSPRTEQTDHKPACHGMTLARMLRELAATPSPR
jgi:hypothetical protein